MFTQTTEYALRAAVRLAASPERLLPSAEIAAQTQVPPDYLIKVLRTLARAGVVDALRGLRGGYRLSRPAHEVTVLDVVSAVEPLRRIERCPLGLPEHTSLCPLHRQIDDAVAHIERQLGATTLAALVGGEAEGTAPAQLPLGRACVALTGGGLTGGVLAGTEQAGPSGERPEN